MEEHGYHRYEISNYCRSGFECRHNLGYWTGVEYLGLGLGASSCVSGFRFKKEENLRTYLAVSYTHLAGGGTWRPSSGDGNLQDL